MDKKVGRPFDEQDVLNELLLDCRRSIRTMASACDRGRQQVWRQIKTFEEDGVIWGYTAIVDESKIGCTLYLALIRGGPPRQEIVDKIIDRHMDFNQPGLEHIRFVDSLFLNGIFDWAIVFAAPGIIDAKRYCGFLEVTYSDYIEQLELMEVMFSAARCGHINPDIQKLRDFAVD